MSFYIALGVLVLWLILEPIIDKQVNKHKEKIEKERREEVIALHAKCDELDAEAEELAQEILKAIKTVEILPEERRQVFYDQYSELMFTVDKIHADTKQARKQFPLEEELVNV